MRCCKTQEPKPSGDPLSKLALLSTASMLIAGSALAADLPSRKFAPVAPAPVAVAVPVFTWTGFYIGAHAGYTFTDNEVRTAGNAANTIANVAANRRPARLSFEDEGFIGGGQLGFNYQLGGGLLGGGLVFGVETDISYTDLSRDRSFTSSVGDPSTFHQSQEFLGTVRGRLGLAFDRVMVYGTGGFAYGEIDNRVEFFRNTDQALQFTGRNSNIETGYAVGGGIEFALPTGSFPLFSSNAVTLKAEYLYYDLKDRSVLVQAVPGVGVNSYTSRFETEGHVVRGGINFKFGG